MKNDTKLDLDRTIELISEMPELIAVLNRILDSEISLPNIPFEVYDWSLWETLAECNGWKLQQNQITKHCRLVDPNNIRKAWGTKNGMLKALESLKNYI